MEREVRHDAADQRVALVTGERVADIAAGRERCEPRCRGLVGEQLLEERSERDRGVVVATTQRHLCLCVQERALAREVAFIVVRVQQLRPRPAAEGGARASTPG